MSFSRLGVDAVLGEGGIYQCRGDWIGVIGRPSPDVLSAKFLEHGFEAVFRPGEEFDCPITELVGFIRTTRAGLKVIDAYHAIGALGGVDAGVWMSECTQAEFDVNLVSISIGNLVEELADVTKSIIEAATSSAKFLKWLTDHWVVVVIVAVLVIVAIAAAYFIWKKRKKS